MCNSVVFHRISPRSVKVQPNLEEHIGEDEDEDEDVQAERIRTSAALSTSNLNEV